MEVPLGDTFYFKFTTRAYSSGQPTQLLGSPVVDIYEENNLTQITGAETLTVDYDGITGLNDLAIVCTTGNGFEVGKYYNAVITTGTVGGTSVAGEVVGPCFRIVPAEDAGAGIRDVNITHISDVANSTTTAQLGVNVVQISGDGPAADNLESDYDGTGYAKTASTIGTATTVTNDVGVNEWNGVALSTTNPLPNAAAGAAGGLPTDSTGKTSFNDISTANVNTEVSDVIKTDTYTLPGQAAPPSTPTFEQAVMWIYKMLRNKKTSTSTTISLYDDAGTTVDAKRTISDDGTTYTEEEIVSGP